MPGWDGYTKVFSTCFSSYHAARDVYGSCFHCVSGRKDRLRLVFCHSILDRNSYHLRMLTTVTLLPLILNCPPSPWILRCFIAETTVDIAETTDMGRQGGEELVPEGEYDIFHQAVQSYLVGFTLVVIMLTISWRTSGH